METPNKKRRLRSRTRSVAMSTIFLAVLIFPTRESHGGEQPTAIDAQGRAHYVKEFKGRRMPYLADVTKAVFPEYRYEDRRSHYEGMGVFRLEIDPKTGIVLRVSTLRSTSYKSLDENSLTALRQWRWKPGTWRRWDVPINFTLTGKSRESSPGTARPFGDGPVGVPAHFPVGVTR